MSPLNPFPQQSGDPEKREGGKIVRANKDGGHQADKAF